MRKVINEGATVDSGIPDAWNNCVELLGESTVLNAIYNYLDSDELEQIINWLIDDYDLDVDEIFS